MNKKNFHSVLYSLLLLSSEAAFADRAYVASTGSDQILVIDTPANSVIATVDLPKGSGPVELAITPNGKEVYVANIDGDSVAVIDTASNALIAVIIVASKPSAIAISADGSRAYAVNSGSDMLSVIHTTSKDITATIPLGNSPSMIALAPRKNRAYVTNAGSDNVSVVDLSSNTMLATISIGLFSFPEGIALSPDETCLYVTGFGSGNVSVIDLATNNILATIPIENGIEEVAISPSGAYAYVTNNHINTVSIIDTASKTIIATVPVGSNPVGVSFAPGGTFAYVANSGSDNISMIDTSKMTVVATVPTALEPYAITFAPPSVQPIEDVPSPEPVPPPPPTPIVKQEKKEYGSIEAKAGYFFFTESKMRKVYDQGGLDLQISGSYPVWKWLQIYASMEFIERHGRSLNAHRKVRLWEYPFTLGLKGVVDVSHHVRYYLTLGPRFFYVHVHNNSPYFARKMNHSTVGGFLGTGFQFKPTRHFFIDIFGEYSYARMHFHGQFHKPTYKEGAQVGGFTFGGGLGYAF